MVGFSLAVFTQGFFTARWVKANSPEEAELLAVDLIKNDKKLIESTLNMNGENQTP